jgi:hypothetical protein
MYASHDYTACRKKADIDKKHKRIASINKKAYNILWPVIY